ncbi:MAG: extracellular solute-binding protein [Candidatus Paceibacterota bacterium]|jgi:multiple sugar transport system substrate-binding protein
MKISIFQGIFIGVLSLAALIGLFVFATHTSTTGGGSDAIGTVVVWGTLPGSDMQSMLTAIKQSDQSLKGVSYVQKNQDTLPSDLASAIATDAAPDLILTNQEELLPLAKFIKPIQFSTLPASAFTTTFIGGAGIFTSPHGDGYYGVPFLVDPMVLFSNRAILSSNGIAKPPATWEALTGLVPNVAMLTSTKQITRGLIALGTYANIHNARGILSSLFLQVGIPISGYSNGILTANLSRAPGEDSSLSGQAVLGFYTQFVDPSKNSYTWNASLQDSRQSFLAGDLALYIGYASESRFLTEANPNLDFIVTELPQPATAKLKSVYGNIYAFMIPRGAKNPGGAYQAAAFLTSPAMQAIAASAFGIAPAITNPLVQAQSDPISAVAYSEALYTKGWLSPAPSDTDLVFSSMIMSVISGRLGTDRALTSSESAMAALLHP